MNAPLVSVIIPAYNQAEFLPETIQSVLNQTYQNFEIIVVDDASPDNTSSVVKQFTDPRIKYIVHEKNLRLPATRNTGMRASQGAIIAFLDADDLFHPAKLLAHVKFLEEHPQVGVSYNARFELNHSAKTIREIWRPPLTVGLEDLMLGFPFSPSDMVIRREWVFQVGLFNPAMGSAEDTDLPCRLALAGCKFAGIDRVLNYRRYHSGRRRKNLTERLNDVARALDAVVADPRCPPAARALRPIAIKHHLMVIISLALIQQETELAQKSVRELVELDPSVIEGHPCELVDFLLSESIADDRVDHAALLKQVFAQLPGELTWLASQYDWAVARGYLWKGVRAIMWDRPEAGRDYFARAVASQAKIDERLVKLITYHLQSYETEFGAASTQAVLEKLTPFLKQVGGQVSVRQVKGSYWVNRAFKNYRNHDYAHVPMNVLRAITCDASYLANRGVLSILARSMAGVIKGGR